LLGAVREGLELMQRRRVAAIFVGDEGVAGVRIGAHRFWLSC